MIPIPPASLRHIGPATTEKDFLESGQPEVARLVRRCRLRSGKTVLDVGCGNGRLAVALLDRYPDIGRYLGLDVAQKFIDWCSTTLTPLNPSFRFIRVDVRNARYNPGGTVFPSSFRLPPPDASFDIINAYSLFSHFPEKDTLAYLSEFRRILQPDGSIFLTAFLEKDVPPCSINPKGYKWQWKGALHCVRYEEEHFVELVEAAGLHLAALDHGTEHNGQSALYLRRKETSFPAAGNTELKR